MATTETTTRYTVRRAELDSRDLRAGLVPGWAVIACPTTGETYEVETWDTRDQARADARNRNAR